MQQRGHKRAIAHVYGGWEAATASEVVRCIKGSWARMEETSQGAKQREKVCVARGLSTSREARGSLKT